MKVAGFTLKEISYIVDDLRIVGVTIKLGEGQTGDMNCYFFRQILRSLYGKPDESETVGGSHHGEYWFATKDEEAEISLTCSKKGIEPKTAVYRLIFEWKGFVKSKFDL